MKRGLKRDQAPFPRVLPRISSEDRYGKAVLETATREGKIIVVRLNGEEIDNRILITADTPAGYVTVKQDGAVVRREGKVEIEAIDPQERNVT